METFRPIPCDEEIREALEKIKLYETYVEYVAYEVGRNYLPEEVTCKKKMTPEEIDSLDSWEVEGIMLTPPKYERVNIAPGFIRSFFTKAPQGWIELYEFSTFLAKLRFNHFLNDNKVRGVFPEMEWTVREFHGFVRIYLNGSPSNVMALRKLDPEKITGFDVEEIPPRYRENHRMKVQVYTKQKEA